MTFEDKLIEAMHKSGIDLQGDIDWSSRDFQRFSVKNHWNRKKPYFVILTGLGASFGDWRDPSTWKTVWEKSYGEMSREEKAEKARHAQQLIYEKNLRRADAIYRAHLMLTHRSHHGETCKEASINHPYILKKKIIPYYAYQIRSWIILPLTDVNRSLVSLQYISRTGFKQFKKHASLKGGMLIMADTIEPHHIIKICEGWATGCTVYEVLGNPVIIAFSANNLAEVATEIRIKYPYNKIIICADNDWSKSENIGLTKGFEAAEISGAYFVYPKNGKGTDWNDLFIEYGYEEVEKQLLSYAKNPL